MFTATAAHLSTLTGTDAALLADDFDAEPITRLTEDESDEAIIALLVEAADDEDNEDFFWFRSVHNAG